MSTSLPMSDDGWRLLQHLSRAREDLGQGWVPVPEWVDFPIWPYVSLGLIATHDVDGRVRLTDFGLAMLGEGLERAS